MTLRQLQTVPSRLLTNGEEEYELKKLYEEPSFDLTKINFGRIMEGGDDSGDPLTHTSIVTPGGGTGGPGGGD